jgi:hypothetical protein
MVNVENGNILFPMKSFNVVFILEKNKSYFLGDFFECWEKSFFICVGACKDCKG